MSVPWVSLELAWKSWVLSQVLCMCWTVGSFPDVPWWWACCSFCAWFAKGTLVKTGQGWGWNWGRAPWGRLLPRLWGHHLPVVQSGDGRQGKGGGAEIPQTFLALSPLTSLSLSTASPFPLQIAPVTLEFRRKPGREAALHHQSPLRPVNSTTLACVGEEDM